MCSEQETWSLWATAWEIPGFYVAILSRSRNTSDTKGGRSVIVEWPSLDDSSKGARGRRRCWITQIRKHCALGIWREFRRKRKAFPLFRVATAAWPVRATADKTEHRFSNARNSSAYEPLCVCAAHLSQLAASFFTQWQHAMEDWRWFPKLFYLQW